jgi:O-antigen/teichoic acid export membrane protein
MRAGQVFAGLGWSAIATGLNAVAQFAFLAVLARLLDAEAFGLMAMAIITLRFASFFAQLGFAQALIQKPELRAVDTSAALVMAIALGICLYAAVLLVAPWFTAYFRAPDLPSVLAGFGWSLLFATLAGLPNALLRRQGRFKAAAGIETAGFLFGYGAVGIAAAAAGWGVWSLVAATLAQQLLTAALGFAVARPALAWPVPRDAFAHLWHFGSRYSAIGFLEFLWANVETLVIGRFFPKAELGIFNRAITLTNLPVEQGVSAVNKVMFPALATLSPEPRRLGDAFCMLLLAVGVVSAALACGIAAAPGDAVALLLGPRWSAAAPVVAVIAFAVPPMFMYVICGVALDSMAALGPKLRLQAFLLLAKVALVAGAAAHGLVGIAAAVVVAEVLRLAFGLRLVMRTLGMTPGEGWAPIAASIGVGAAIYAAVGGTAAVAQSVGFTFAVRLAAEAGAGALAFVASLLFLVAAAPGYAPLGRFESVRLMHGRLLAVLHLAPVRR